MDMRIENGRHGDWAVLEVTGELDLATGPAFREALASRDGPRVAVDLSGVTFMDSSSLGILVAALKHAREQGGELALIGVTGSPAKVFALTGLDGVFPMVASAAALSDLG